MYSASSEGKIPWVSVDDIAAVAFEVMTSEEAPNTDYLILGPELLSYGDVSYAIRNSPNRQNEMFKKTDGKLSP